MPSFDVCLFLYPGRDSGDWIEGCREIEIYARTALSYGLTDVELQEDIAMHWPDAGRRVEVLTGADNTVCIYLIARE